MPGPNEVRIPVLLTCTLCHGELTYDNEQGELCACPRCESGWESTSVPASVFLNAHHPSTTPAESYAALAAHILAHPRTNHSLFAHLAVDLPAGKLGEIRRQRL